MDIPASDLLRDMAAALARQAQDRLQHKKAAYIAAETQRLADYQDSCDTRRQLAQYGVTL